MEPPDILVRAAGETDLEAINAIHNPEIEHGTATWDTVPWTIEWLAAYEGWRTTGQWTASGRHLERA